MAEKIHHPLRRVLPALMLCCFIGPGCSKPNHERPRHYGPRINIAHFVDHTEHYEGKSILLELTVDEPIDRMRGQTLRGHVGKEVRFKVALPRKQTRQLVIAIPPGLTVPEVGHGDTVIVFFTCTRGDLQAGNVAKSVEVGMVDND